MTRREDWADPDARFAWDDYEREEDWDNRLPHEMIDHEPISGVERDGTKWTLTFPTSEQRAKWEECALWITGEECPF